MTKTLLAIGGIGVVLGGWTGCSPSCDKSACEATQDPQTGAAISQGIAGVVASQSDACDNGCCGCAHSTAHFDVWKVDAPVKNAAEAAATVSGSDPTFGFDADAQYARELAPGSYLVCKLPGACAAVTIGAGEVFTVNAKLVFGPPQLVVFAPNADAPSTGVVFAVSQTRD